MAIEITSQSLAGAQREETTAYKESLPRALSGFPATDKSVSRSRFWHPNSRWTRRNFSSRATELSGGAAAPGCVHLFVRTSASASALSLLCARNVTANRVFLG